MHFEVWIRPSTDIKYVLWLTILSIFGFLNIKREANCENEQWLYHRYHVYECHAVVDALDGAPENQDRKDVWETLPEIEKSYFESSEKQMDGD